MSYPGRKHVTGYLEYGEETPAHLEPLNLQRLTEYLADKFRGMPPEHYVPGKTLVRDAVVAAERCSVADAEQIVDTLERAGYIRFVLTEDAEARGVWFFDAQSLD